MKISRLENVVRHPLEFWVKERYPTDHVRNTPSFAFNVIEHLWPNIDTISSQFRGQPRVISAWRRLMEYTLNHFRILVNQLVNMPGYKNWAGEASIVE